jgi:hypothetical protein
MWLCCIEIHLLMHESKHIHWSKTLLRRHANTKVRRTLICLPPWFKWVVKFIQTHGHGFIQIILRKKLQWYGSRPGPEVGPSLPHFGTLWHSDRYTKVNHGQTKTWFGLTAIRLSSAPGKSWRCEAWFPTSAEAPMGLSQGLRFLHSNGLEMDNYQFISISNEEFILMVNMAYKIISTCKTWVQQQKRRWTIYLVGRNKWSRKITSPHWWTTRAIFRGPISWIFAIESEDYPVAVLIRSAGPIPVCSYFKYIFQLAICVGYSQVS